MSVFEAKVVLTLLKNSTAIPPLEKNMFEKHWTASVEKRVVAWKESRNHKRNPRPDFQLKWEAEVVEYVQMSRVHFNVPLLGPRFLPPTYLHSHKRPGGGPVEPALQYLEPLNIIHPFYFPQLAQCPRCSSHDGIVWEVWTSTGSRELHGLCYEELALGAQLHCNICKEHILEVMGALENSS
ncbi:hypothetical protein EV424DRAFT_1472649 [Suillus variegatus]|nr:hypothetical protein EV424DRAFT_1472649 [Suillus variegatus]